VTWQDPNEHKHIVERATDYMKRQQPWQEMIDPESGRVFWWNKTDPRMTTWKDPYSITKELRAWDNDRFGCFDDLPSAALGCILPCYAWGEYMERAKFINFYAAMFSMCGTSYCYAFIMWWVLGLDWPAMTPAGFEKMFTAYLMAGILTSIIGTYHRKKLTEKYPGLEFGVETREFCCFCWCFCCTICQEYRTVMNHTDPEGGWEELDVIQPLSLKTSEFSVPLRTELYQAKTNVAKKTFASIKEVRAEMDEEHKVIKKRAGKYREEDEDAMNGDLEAEGPDMEMEEMAPQPPPRDGISSRFRCC